MKLTKDIRNELIEKYKAEDFVIDKSGSKMVELIGATFIADEDWIIRKPNYEYVERELQWYESQSLFVEDIPGETPVIWKAVSDKNGKINSNYGWCIFSEENGNQYNNAITSLLKNPFSRQATMIYNRPSMHIDAITDGKSDFMCTYANSLFIRDNKLISHYIMRSNDAVFGFCNDFHWAKHVQEKAFGDLKKSYPNLELGDIIWTASSFHVYERHFKFLDEFVNQ